MNKRIGFFMVMVGPIGTYIAAFTWRDALFAIGIHLIFFGTLLFVWSKD